MSLSSRVSCSSAKKRRLLDRQRRDLADVFAADLYLPRLGPQAQPAALRAEGISAISAEEDAHMQLVFLALQMLEESAHAPELVVALDHPALLLGAQIGPGHIERNAGRARVAPHLGRQRLVLRLGPRLDRAFRQRQRLVGNHQVQVEIDGVAEALAPGTSAVRDC